MRVYIAAPWSHKADALAAKQQFEAAGCEVTAHWIIRESILEYDDLTKPEHKDECTEQAQLDVADILQSDVFVILNLALSEGKATEMGIAYALGIPIILVGDLSRNLFYRLPGVYRADSVEAAVEGVKLGAGLAVIPSTVEVN